MKQLCSRIYASLAKLVRKITGRQTRDEIQYTRVALWNSIHGDKTLRLTYPLTASSVVVDVGGFEGQWASDIFGKYCCSVVVFEPVHHYAQEIRERFALNPKITCYDVGLSHIDTETSISLLGDKTSVFQKSDSSENVRMVAASAFFAKHHIENIDLIKINIEGEEYNLLDDLIASGHIKKIQNIQVQFHDFAPDAVARMRATKEMLMKTHHPTYQYEFVWENWERNEHD